MRDIVLVIDVISAVALIGLILLQQGKGADMGTSFGSGASQTLFGAQGSANFLTRLTGILAALFFLNCLLLGYLGAYQQIVDPLKNIEQYSQTNNQTALQKPESEAKD